MPRDGNIRVERGGEGSSYRVAQLGDMHFGDTLWTDGGKKEDLNSINGMSNVLDIERPGMQQLASMLTPKKPRFLCLHGHGSNATKLKEHFEVWPDFVTKKMEFVYINGPFPIDNDGFEWFALSKVNTEYDNFEEGIAYIEDRMIELGPFDGVLGFSEGAVITGSLPGMQEQGVCLKKVGKIKHVIIISGAKLGGKAFPQPKLAEAAYISPINIPSLHMFGENDIARPNAPELVDAYVDPLVFYHHGGHEVPKLDEEGLKIMFEFLKKIKANI